MTMYTFLSPGVYHQVIDLTVRQALANSTAGAIVLESKKGSMGVTFIGNYTDLEDIYGKADPAVSFGIDCAEAFLADSKGLWLNRVINGALYAGLDYFNDTTSKTALAATPRPGRLLRRAWPIGRAANFEGGLRPTSLLTVSADFVSLNRVELTITDGQNVVEIDPVVFASGITTHDLMMDALATNISAAMNTLGSGASAVVLDEVTGNNYCIALYHPTNTQIDFDDPDVTLGVSQPNVVIDDGAHMFAVTAENPGTWANDFGIRLSNVDLGIKQRVRLTMGGPLITGCSLTANINGTVIGPVAFTTSSDATLAAFAAAITAALPNIVGSATVSTVSGAVNNDRSIDLVAKFEGPEQIKVLSFTASGGSAPAVMWQETLRGLDGTAEFDLDVFSRANVFNPNERHRTTFLPRVNASGVQTDMTKRVNASTGSRRIRVIPNTHNLSSLVLNSTVVNGVPQYDTTIAWMAGGDDGAKALNSQIADGWNAFSNRERIPTRIFMNAGYTAVNVQQKMVSVAEARIDAFAVLDMPSDKQATQAARNYRLEDMNINSSFGAIYTPDLRVVDSRSDEPRFIPPSGHVGGIYARNDQMAGVWFAPAGLNRGKLKNILGLRVEYDQGARDILNPIGVNCLIDRPGYGPVVWGEETLQFQKSILSAVHSQRLLSALQVAYADTLDYVALFEPNNRFTRFKVRQVGDKILKPIREAGGLDNYLIKCDEDNNPPEIRDQEVLRVDMYLQITPTSKYILLRSILTPSGPSFAVYITEVSGQAAA